MKAKDKDNEAEKDSEEAATTKSGKKEALAVKDKKESHKSLNKKKNKL